MASNREQFVMPAGMKKWGLGLTAVGVLALVLGIALLAFSSDEHSRVRFWAVLLQNSTYFLLVVNASMFFICATTLALAAWPVALRRIPEAISTLVPIFGILAFIVLMGIVFGTHDGHHIYHWVDKDAVANDPVLKGKSGFLSPTFFTVWTALTLGAWWYFGKRMRQLGDRADAQPMGLDEAKKFTFSNTVRSAIFLVAFGLTVASTIPWLWLMSIDAHWYSTMYSWYTFASTFVSGMSLIAIFVVFLKNQGYLSYVTEEHIHDVGKFMFAFSIFWTYLWFSQYMLIWYSNQPEETKYFQPRLLGNYRGIFFLNLILNFVAPFIILMKRGTKRNYTILTFAAVIIIFGHWLDFYQMVMPGTVGEHAHLSWYEFGIGIGYVGLIIWLTGRALEKRPLVSKFHPFLKESIVHHT
ncbi:MAG: quinol:cytochrome C oxidoreductase [Bacteroidota bacterium]